MALNKIPEYLLGFKNGFGTQKFIATEGQTLFTLTNGSYKTGQNRLEVYIHGIKQAKDAFSETSSTSFTLSEGVPLNTEVEAKFYESILPSVGGHNSNHKKGGVDELKVDELGNYKELIDDRFGNLSGLDWLPASLAVGLQNLRDWQKQTAINVRTPPYNAKGDGVTDDTAAITSAIATGKNVYFPPPTVSYLSGLQTVSTQGQQLFGAGVISVIQATTATSNLFSVQADYVSIVDLRLNGVATSNANNTFAISTSSANAAKDLTVGNVLFSGADSTKGFNNAVKFDDGCHFGTVINCKIQNLWGNVSGTGYGVLVGNNNGCRIIINKMIATSSRGRHGVYTSGGTSDCVVDGNYINGFDQEGISQYSTGAQPPCARNIYTNNNIINCSAASNNVSSGAIGLYGHMFSIKVDSNTITGSGEMGIVVDSYGFNDCLDTEVIGNTVLNSATTGIDIIGANGLLLSDNTVKESSQSSTGTYANINLKTDGTNAVNDCLIANNRSFGPSKARCAFRIDPSTPTPTGIKLVGNKFGMCAGGETLELNGVTCEIDGRIQFRQDNVSYGPIANGSSLSTTYSIPGADQGDTVTVSHSSDVTGCALFGTVTSIGNVQVNVLNMSGASKTISAGSLRIDCWKRVAPLN